MSHLLRSFSRIITIYSFLINPLGSNFRFSRKF
nr:MAG TPA: hypothetical protein [Caudoviricetes sp.]